MLGYASVGRMLGEVTSEELSEWMAYFNMREDKEKERKAAAQAKAKARKQGY
jgi:hypothetical protein